MCRSLICGVPSPNGGDKAARTWGSRASENPPMKPEEGRLAVAKVTDNQNGLTGLPPLVHPRSKEWDFLSDAL